MVEQLLRQNIKALTGPLPVDYGWAANGKSVLGENKTALDLIASASDGRLHRQMESLKKADLGFIMLEGGLSVDGYTVGSWTYEAFDDLLMSLQCEGVVVVHSPYASATARRLAALYRWTQKEKHGSWHEPIAFLPPLEDIGDDDYRSRIGMLMHLPKCGPNKATKLVREFGLAGALNFTPEQVAEAQRRWVTIPGIGDKLAETWGAWLLR